MLDDSLDNTRPEWNTHVRTEAKDNDCTRSRTSNRQPIVLENSVVVIFDTR